MAGPRAPPQALVGPWPATKWPQNIRPQAFKLRVGVTCYPYLLEAEGLFTQG